MKSKQLLYKYRHFCLSFRQFKLEVGDRRKNSITNFYSLQPFSSLMRSRQLNQDKPPLLLFPKESFCCSKYLSKNQNYTLQFFSLTFVIQQLIQQKNICNLLCLLNMYNCIHKISHKSSPGFQRLKNKKGKEQVPEYNHFKNGITGKGRQWDGTLISPQQEGTGYSKVRRK